MAVHLPAGSETAQTEAFVQEEGDCCPFLAFAATEADGRVILEIIHPEVN